MHSNQLLSPSLFALVERQAQLQKDRVALSFFAENRWNLLSFSDLFEQSKQRAEALVRSGHKPGDRIALLGGTSLDWPIQFLGIVFAGATAVPLDSKLTVHELENVLRHADVRSLIISRAFASLGEELKDRVGFKKLMILEEPYSLGSLDEPRLPAPDPEKLAAIFYTSGTTGKPKGVMVSEKSILAELTLLCAPKDYSDKDVVFSILPFNHLFGLNAALLFAIATGFELVLAHGFAPADIAICLKDRRPTRMNVVPLFLNVLKTGLEKKFRELPERRRSLVKFFLKYGPYLPLGLRRKIFADVHAHFGGRLASATSGSAPLDSATIRFFEAIGIYIYEGYGLTETGPVLSANWAGAFRRGTVGKPVPGLEVKIEDGEIWARGPVIMSGYYQDPGLTAEVITPDGWFKTGDLGSLDSRGFLRIQGRKKNLIVLKSGKKVQGEEIDHLLAASPFFREVCTLGLTMGNQGEQVVLLVVPNESLLDIAESTAELQGLVEAEVAKLSEQLASFKRPSRVLVRVELLPRTSTGKIKQAEARRLAKEAIQ